MGESSVDARGEVRHGVLNKAALGVSSTEEGDVDEQEDPAALGESESGQDETEEESDLEGGHQTHAGIVVLLHEFANVVGQRGRLASRRLGGRGRDGGSTVGSLGLGLQGRDEIGPGVGRNVENRIHAEWQERQRDLAGVEPDKGHC